MPKHQRNVSFWCGSCSGTNQMPKGCLPHLISLNCMADCLQFCPHLIIVGLHVGNSVIHWCSYYYSTSGWATFQASGVHLMLVQPVPALLNPHSPFMLQRRVTPWGQHGFDLPKRKCIDGDFVPLFKLNLWWILTCSHAFRRHFHA